MENREDGADAEEKGKKK